MTAAISGLDIQGAMLAAKAQVPATPPHGAIDTAMAKKVAGQFEASFIGEFMGQMFEGIPTDGPFGGGEGEEMFRSLLTDEYGKQIEASGGFGLSDAITRQLLQMQEARVPANPS
ncbi:MAG TPA: rod-binding protein [Rhizomicrobium sp.]|nr:rod-binding protein [Rhizomicrobium sp.]